MRVLHVTRDFPPRCKGGISTATGGMVRASVDAGLTCAVLSFDGWRPKARQHAAAPPERSRMEPGTQAVDILRVSAPAHLEAARASAASFDPDIIHVHHSMLWPFAEELAAASGAPAVLQVHVLQREQNRLRGISEQTMSLAAQEQALARAPAVIAPSHAVAARLLADDSLPNAAPLAPRLHVVSLGVHDSPAARDAVTQRHPQRVLYAGRFADINGTAELFAALPAIVAQVPAVEITIAGGVPDNRKAEARWLARWQRDAPEAARQRVRFAGWLGPDELAAEYRRAAVLLSPSWFETFGLVVLEAMLHGAAVCATRAGGVAELIDHEATGLLSAPQDVEALARHAVRLLEHPAEAQRLGRAAAEAARQERLWPEVIPGLLRVYERAIEHGSPQHV